MNTSRHEAVAGVVDPSLDGSAETAITDRGYSFPNSRKIYVSGKLHPDVRVPFREITLAPTKSISGEIEINEPVRVYDTSGPWGDPDFHGDVTQGLPPLRGKWIGDRGDVEEYEGRNVQPLDDGFLSEAQAARATKNRPPARGGLGEGGPRNIQHPPPKSERDKGAGGHSGFDVQPWARGVRCIPGAKPLRVPQFWGARHGIITP